MKYRSLPVHVAVTELAHTLCGSQFSILPLMVLVSSLNAAVHRVLSMAILHTGVQRDQAKTLLGNEYDVQVGGPLATCR